MRATDPMSEEEVRRRIGKPLAYALSNECRVDCHSGGAGQVGGGGCCARSSCQGGVAVWPPEVAEAGRIANDVNLAAWGVIVEGTTRGGMF
jgi:hypothetical protein